MFDDRWPPTLYSHDNTIWSVEAKFIVFFVDMAQPMANAAFYYLEPQAMDGFVGWGLLDDTLRARGVERYPVVYPIFKYRKEIAQEGR